MGKPGFIAGSRAEDLYPERFLRALPPERPIAMPRQAIGARRQRLRARGSCTRWVETGLARVLLALATGGLTAFGLHEIHGVMVPNGITGLQWVFIGLFALNFAWISFAASQSILGFFRQMALDLVSGGRKAPDFPEISTAILVPVYNENPHTVAAAVLAMAEGLAARAPGRFSFFILSDSNRPTPWMSEEAAFRHVIEGSNPACPIYYRHRRSNEERKAGNIGDWVMRWGGAYDAMIVLDADSLMAPDTMIEMARRLEADPGLGLIQSLPSIQGARSVFARMQQFANRCYGPIFGNGLAVWHGHGSNFWGHNAIIRVQAFADAARLPTLSGKPPFGGHVLSHDFIEAAFLRRAGWGVRFDTDLQGSYEEAPPSFVDLMVRDRRWCQGNLQHVRFLFARGLTLTTRLHLLSGIQAYLSAVLWFALVLVGVAIAIQAALSQPVYFSERSLFPTWPIFDSERAVALFIVSMGLVLTPKLLGWLGVLFNPRRVMRFGGPIMLTVSVVTEMIGSVLYAPIMMMAQGAIVFQVLTGQDSGWTGQRRGSGNITLATAVRAHFWHGIVGVALAVVAYFVNVAFFFWMLPVTLGLILAVPLSKLSGSAALGLALKRIAVLRTPEEQRRSRPEILKVYARHLDAVTPQFEGPLHRLAGDPALRAWHVGQLDTANDHTIRFDPNAVIAQAKIEQCADLDVLQDWLMVDEMMALLNDRHMLETLFEDERADAGQDLGPHG